MKKRVLVLAMALSVAMLSTGCVKVIDKGTENEYTGKVVFDAASSSEELWDQVVENITENAVELPTLLTDADGKLASVAEKYGVNQKSNYDVKGTGVVTDVDVSKSAGYMVVKLDGYDGSEEVKIQVGPTFKNKDALGDSQTVTGFEQYTNQTEWGQIKDAFIEKVKTTVIDSADAEGYKGKTISFVGAFSASMGSSDILIIPISIEEQ